MPDAPEEQQDSQDAPVDIPTQEEPAGTETAVTSQGGKRRGRRKVMKKKTVKDEEGYLGKPHGRFKRVTQLIFYSDPGRSGLGVILRRRTSS